MPLDHLPSARDFPTTSNRGAPCGHDLLAIHFDLIGLGWDGGVLSGSYYRKEVESIG
jgi:hypothetical protein